MGGAQASQRTPEDFRQTSTYEDFPRRVHENDTAIVLDNYPPPDICEPIFRMGDWLKIVSEEGYWWKVCSVNTKEVNYIPHCHASKVYHGWLFENVSRPKAEELLRLPGNRVGSFLIRESTKGMYSLSVRHRAIKHYRIVRMPNNWYYISPRLTFQCLEDLVNHYSDIADGLCCVLTGPCLTVGETPLSLPSTEGRKLSFDWRAVNSAELVHQSTSPSAVSYGVQNSVSSYLSLLGEQEKPERKKFSLKKKRWKSVYLMPNHQLDSLATVEDNYEEVL
ncbi:src-like-adapter [Megalobrama amblycephala]|uniref:src-like-adapter n=1 Tax=Megalobrama amblycephala TaxID=75352 RepID=UPI0020142C70|nr:src-like-adapter [Megalobrama amblycephala]